MLLFCYCVLKLSKPGELHYKKIVSTDQDLKPLLKIYIKHENLASNKKTSYYVDAHFGCGQVNLSVQ